MNYSIPAAPAYTLTMRTDFPYFNASGDIASPTVGLGFSFQNHNKPIDLTTHAVNGITGVIGLKFWAAVSDTTHPFQINVPDIHTDVADLSESPASNNDQWGPTTCTCSENRDSNWKGTPTGANVWCIPTAGVTTSTAVDSAGNALHSCYAFWRYNIQAADTGWHQYAVPFSALVHADITAADNVTAPANPWADNTAPLDLKNALKVQFEPYDPQNGEPAGAGEICVNNVDFMMTGDTTPAGEVNQGG
jgi:hypothetical protein